MSVESNPVIKKTRKRKSKKLVTITEPEAPRTITLPEIPSDEGHIEGQSWVWPDGKKTPMKFIQDAVIRSKPLPKGFYKAAKASSNTSFNHMANIATQRNIPELK